MPRTSAASIRRAARGLPDRAPVDPVLAEKRRKAAQARWAKARGIDPAVSQQKRLAAESMHGRAIVSRGGEAMHARAFVAQLHERQTVVRSLVLQTAVEGASEAMAYLLRLVRAEGDCRDAPHQVRRLAALDILSIARVHGHGTDAAKSNDGDLHEMPRAALMALLGDLQRQAAQVVLDCEPSEPQPDTQSG